MDDVLSVSVLRLAAERSALGYDIKHDPRMCPPAEHKVDGEDYAAIYTPPRSVEDLLARATLVERSAALGGCIVLLQEVGSDALFALLGATRGMGNERARAHYEHVRSRDLSVAVAQTDVKGDRSLGPAAQPDPDLYVRIVDEDEHSVVVRGAKTHTSFSFNTDVILVIPTRAMRPADAA